MKFILSTLFIALLLVSCGNEAEELKSDNTGTSSAIIEIGDKKLTLPEGWKNTEPSNKMRQFEFEIDRSKGLVVAGFYFGEQSGLEEANIERWKGQFTVIESEMKSMLAGGNTTLLEIQGTYKDKPFPMAQEFNVVENFMMLAAIVKTGKGPYYFKLTGSKELLEEQKEHFGKFLESYR